MTVAKNRIDRSWFLICATAVFAGNTAKADTPYSWKGENNAVWSIPSDWVGDIVPNAQGAVATFGQANSPLGARVEVNGAFTVSGLTFSDRDWTLFPTDATNAYKLILANSTGGGSATVTVNSTASIGVILDSSSSTGNSGLIKAGTGTLTLTNAANTYTGATVINAGTLSIALIGNGGQAGGSTLGASNSGVGNLTFGGGTLSYTGTGPTAGTDRGFTLASGGGTINVSQGGTNLTFSGGSTGAGGLTKTGAGSLTLSGTNAFNGTTAVTSGTLFVSGGGTLGASGAGNAGAVTVSATGVLGGTGTINGAVNVGASGSTGGTLGAGDSVGAAGTLTLSNGLTFFNSSSNFVVDFASPASYDLVNLTAGNVLLNNATLTVNGAGTGYTMGTKYVIINDATGTVSGTFNNLAEGATVPGLTFGGMNWAIHYEAHDVYLTPTPEPGAVLGVVAAGFGLTRYVRRRRVAAV